MEHKKTIRPILVVAADKVEKFLAQKPDPMQIAERKRLVAMFRENNEEAATRNRYFRLLADEIMATYGISRKEADCAIKNSAIQALIREDPEYVDHVPLSCWAEEVYNEHLNRVDII